MLSPYEMSWCLSVSFKANSLKLEILEVSLECILNLEESCFN